MRRLRAAPEQRGHSRHYTAARNGELPAEALPTRLRWRLVAELHATGWTDLDIAQWTRMSTYTAARIREGMGLRPNRRRPEGSDTT